MKSFMIKRVASLSMLCAGMACADGYVDTTEYPQPWTGFYIGANGGGTWAGSTTKVLPLPSPDQFGAAKTTLLTSLAGGVAGGQIGYNWQIAAYPGFIFGLEADMDWTSLSGSSPYTTGYGAGPTPGEVFHDAYRSTQSSSWIGTFRPRLGFLARDNLMIYGTGGLAYGNLDSTGIANFNPVGNEIFPASLSVSRAGWTAGAGAEVAFWQNWTAKIEYIYYDLGSTSVVANPSLAHPPFQMQYTWSNTSQIIRMGINYRFF